MRLEDLKLNNVMKNKIVIVFISIISISVIIFFVFSDYYTQFHITDESPSIKLLIKENNEVNDAIHNKDWDKLYEIKKRYWLAKNLYISRKDYFLKNHEEAFWVKWPVVRMVSYKVDTLKFDNDSSCIKATTKNYYESYHLFAFWHRYKDTMRHIFEYYNDKWYLTGFGHSNTEPDTSEYTIEEIDSVFYKNWGKYYKKE